MTLPPAEFAIMAAVFALVSAVALYRAGRHNWITIRLDDGAELEGTDVEQLDLIEAMERRDTALETVADNNARWIAQAIAAVTALPDNTVGTGEDFRVRLGKQGLPAPSHSNAWGSLFMTLTKRKVLVPTGEYRPMTDVRSHGRKTPVYVKQTPEAA